MSWKRSLSPQSSYIRCVQIQFPFASSRRKVCQVPWDSHFSTFSPDQDPPPFELYPLAFQLYCWCWSIKHTESPAPFLSPFPWLCAWEVESSARSRDANLHVLSNHSLFWSLSEYSDFRPALTTDRSFWVSRNLPNVTLYLFFSM